MKKIISLLLAMIMVMAMFAGCNNTPATTEPSTEPSTEPAPSDTQPTESVEGATVSFVSISYGETYDAMGSLMFYIDENNAFAVDYVGQVKKVGIVDASAQQTLSTALANSGLVALNGAFECVEGEAYASMYVEYTDGSCITADYSGVVAQEFIDGYAKMDECFQTLTADLSVYVPEAQVMEGVDETALVAMQEILNNSGLPNLDGLMISNVPAEEFEFSLGLSSSEGITNGTACNAMMMTTAYSIALVTVEDAANIAAVRADFEENIDWQKWVCVMPTDALIAQKDNMVICVIGADEMFDMTATSVEAAGWTEVKYIENDLG